jgi:hypothetical protein
MRLQGRLLHFLKGRLQKVLILCFLGLVRALLLKGLFYIFLMFLAIFVQHNALTIRSHPGIAHRTVVPLGISPWFTLLSIR